MPDHIDWTRTLSAAFAQEIQLTERQLIKQKRELEQRRIRQLEREVAVLKEQPRWPLARTVKRLGIRPRSENTIPTPPSPIAPQHNRTDELNTRIQQVLAQLGTPLDTSAASDASKARDVLHSDVGGSLDRLCALLDSRPEDKPLAWLTYLAILARYPSTEDLRRFHSALAVRGAHAAIAALINQLGHRKPTWAERAELRLVRKPLVDVTATSRRDSHTGVQRVVREVVPRWAANHDLELVRWSPLAECYGLVSSPGRRRVLAFEPADDSDEEAAHPNNVVVIPWQTTVLNAENITNRERSTALSCLADWSGSQLATVFHDLIAYTFPERFSDSARSWYGSTVISMRSSHRVSTVSQSVAGDLIDFSSMVERVGVRSPSIRSNLLPVEAFDVQPSAAAASRATLYAKSDLPIVLSVGSIEPRKNHISMMRASEALWNEGLEFQLVFVGWHSWGTPWFDDEFSELRRRGYPIQVISEASEELLWTAYRSAQFSMYLSHVEGYGLPAAESIACGTPVLLSKVGSMEEIGTAGGAEFVDPYDLDSVTNGMRTLLTDPQRLAELRDETLAVPSRTWDDYATATWSWLVDADD